jgi:photosystem II stability/assembly factor-like uncharacterized protein
MNYKNLKNIVIIISLLFWIPFNISFAQWSWFPLNSGTNLGLNTLSVINAETIFICGDSGTVLKTTNGGLNWSHINVGTSTSLQLISFANVNTGIVGDYGTTTWRTTNGGINWTILPLSLRYQVQFTDSITAYAVGAGYQVMKTTNAGTNWISKNVSSSNSFYTLWFANSLTGFCGSGGGEVFKTTDGGDNWTHVNLPGQPIYWLTFGDINTGYVSSSGSIIRTTNSGFTWQLISSGGNTAFGFLNGSTGFLANVNSDTLRALLRTTQMCNTWDTSYCCTPLYDGKLVTQDTAYAIGPNGLILKSLRGGKRFYTVSGSVTYRDNNQPVDSGYVKALYYDYSTARIVTVDSTRILSGGIYILHQITQDSLDIMFYQNDDELDFVPTYYPSTTDWKQAVKIYATGNLTGINGQVYRITNSGNPYSISGSAFQNSAGDSNIPLNGVIVYALIGNEYKNYGITLGNGVYVADKLPPGNYNLTAYRMGFNSVSQSVNITNGNMQNINFNFGSPISVPPTCCQVPSAFNLYQNYPNPFNPETIIKFDVPKDQRVKIVIYDLTGREVNKLLNEEVKAGTYNVRWNGSNYASGVYFYRIETESYTLTKKMLLIK